MSDISIKRLLIIIIIFTVLISITIFAVTSNGYVNGYFEEYIESVYETNVDNIVEFAGINLIYGKQQKSILNSYVVEPIYYATIYDEAGSVVLSSGGVGSRFVIDDDTMDTEYYDIVVDGRKLGEVMIVRAKNIAFTNTKQVFNRAIYMGALIAAVLVFIIMGVIGIFIIRYIAGDTKKVVHYANDENIKSVNSRITEFSDILSAIDIYRQKLAFKEKVRKEKFDRILHETKTPITVLKSQLEGAADKIISIDSNRALEMVKEVDKLDTVLKDATTIIEGNEIEDNIEMINTDYSNHIEKIVDSLRARFSKKGLDLIYEKKPFEVNTDVKLLDNALYNIIINSYKYTNSGSVTLATNDSEIIITDTGIGIKEDEIDKIFNPYFRGSNLGDIGGEGLGLYNVKTNLAKLNIDINIESKESEYTKIKLIFKS